MDSQINIAGQILPAAICNECGSRLYPPSLLDKHMKIHDPDPEIALARYMREIGQQWTANRPGKTHVRGRGRPRKRESDKKWPAINILQSMSGRRG